MSGVSEGVSGDSEAVSVENNPEAESGLEKWETGAQGAEWLCPHCGDSHETHEGDCCCHGHDEGDDE